MIAAQYPLSAYPSPSVAFSALDTDAIFACPALNVDQWTSKYVPTFAYEFNDENAPERFLPPVSFPYGAAHESEPQYLFGLPTADPSRARYRATAAAGGQHAALLGELRRARFPVLGRPAAWPAFGSHSQQMLSLVPPGPRSRPTSPRSTTAGSGASAA